MDLSLSFAQYPTRGQASFGIGMNLEPDWRSMNRRGCGGTHGGSSGSSDFKDGIGVSSWCEKIDWKNLAENDVLVLLATVDLCSSFTAMSALGGFAGGGTTGREIMEQTDERRVMRRGRAGIGAVSST